MNIDQLIQALGLQRAYQAYQQNIGEPFAAIAGGAGRGYLGLDKPQYGGLLAEDMYRAGQAMGNMPGLGAPAGAFKAVAQAPELLGLLGALSAPRIGMTMKETVRSSAVDLADQLNKLGFSAQVEHSGSKAGPSSYVRIFDPETGRMFQNQVRFSDHSKGPFQNQFVFDVQDVEQDIPKIIESALQMRAMGPSETVLKSKRKEEIVSNLVQSGMKPRQAYRQAEEIIKNEFVK